MNRVQFAQRFYADLASQLDEQILAPADAAKIRAAVHAAGPEGIRLFSAETLERAGIAPELRPHFILQVLRARIPHLQLADWGNTASDALRTLCNVEDQIARGEKNPSAKTRARDLIAFAAAFRHPPAPAGHDSELYVFSRIVEPQIGRLESLNREPKGERFRIGKGTYSGPGTFQGQVHDDGAFDIVRTKGSFEVRCHASPGTIDKFGYADLKHLVRFCEGALRKIDLIENPVGSIDQGKKFMRAFLDELLAEKQKRERTTRDAREALAAQISGLRGLVGRMEKGDLDRLVETLAATKLEDPSPVEVTAEKGQFYWPVCNLEKMSDPKIGDLVAFAKSEGRQLPICESLWHDPNRTWDEDERDRTVHSAHEITFVKNDDGTFGIEAWHATSDMTTYDRPLLDQLERVTLALLRKTQLPIDPAIAQGSRRELADDFLRGMLQSVRAAKAALTPKDAD